MQSTRCLKLVRTILLIETALLLNAVNGYPASKQFRANHHKSEAAKQSESIQQQEPQVPLSVLHEALGAIKEQDIAAEKQAEAYEETWHSPSVLVNIALAGIGAGYLIFAALQWRVLYGAFLADHRPQLGILHIALLTAPDDILAANSEGLLKQDREIEVQVTLINRGGTSAKSSKATLL